MFYVYNDINTLANKKNFNPYREAIKVLVKDIKNTDFDKLINTSLYLKSDVSSEVEKIILKIYSMKDNNYKSIEKELVGLHKKFGLMNLLKLYVVSTNQILDSYLFNKCVHQSKMVEFSINKELFYETCALLSSVVMYSIVITNDLLKYKIEYISNDGLDYKLVKSLRRENISLMKGLYNIPVLLPTKEAATYRNALNSNKMSLNHIQSYMDVYTVLSFQAFSELLFFKGEYKKYFTFNYVYDTNVLYKKRIFSIEHNIIKLRKVLPPKGGVILKVKNDNDIESIFLNEKGDIDTRVIGGIVRYTDGTEEDFIFMLNNFVSSSIFCSHSEKVFMALLLFYEVEYENFYKILNKYGRVEFEVLSPYYWRYRKNNYETTKEKEERLKGNRLKREHTVNISTFIRKIKGNPSKEAQELAEKLCVKLEPNYTIVREHKRTYNKEANKPFEINKLLELLKDYEF